MYWQFGGNFARVQMICELDWRDCPRAVVSYVWSEIVTDVLDYLTKDGMEWRVLAVLLAVLTLFRIIHSKATSRTVAIQEKEIISQVGSKMEDLELKVNVLTYKLQYGTWPLPHQIHGTCVKRGSQNVRLSLSGPNDYTDWIRGLPLRRNRQYFTPHGMCQFDQFFEWGNMQPHMQYNVLPIKYKNSKHSDSSSDKSLAYHSDRQRRNSTYSQGMDKISKSEELQMCHRHENQISSSPKRYNSRMSYKERVSRDLSFYRRCYEFRAYERFTKTLEECKTFLRELHNNNKHLRLICSSTEFNPSSITDTGLDSQIERTQCSRGKYNKNSQYLCKSEKYSVQQKPIGDVKLYAIPDKSNDTVKGMISSATDITNQKDFQREVSAIYSAELIPQKANKNSAITLRTNSRELNSEKTLHEVRKRLESLYNVLENLEQQDFDVSLKKKNCKVEQACQDAINTVECIIGDVKDLNGFYVKEEKMNYSDVARNETISCLYSVEESKINEYTRLIRPLPSKECLKDNCTLKRNKKPDVQRNSILMNTEDDTSVISSNSSSNMSVVSQDVEYLNPEENVDDTVNSVNNNQQLPLLDIITEEQYTETSTGNLSPSGIHSQEINPSKKMGNSCNLREELAFFGNIKEAESSGEKKNNGSIFIQEKDIVDPNGMSGIVFNSLQLKYFNKQVLSKDSDANLTLGHKLNNLEDIGSVSQDKKNQIHKELSEQKNKDSVLNSESNQVSDLKRYPGLCSLVDKQSGYTEMNECNAFKSSDGVNSLDSSSTVREISQELNPGRQLEALATDVASYNNEHDSLYASRSSTNHAIGTEASSNLKATDVKTHEKSNERNHVAFPTNKNLSCSTDIDKHNNVSDNVRNDHFPKSDKLNKYQESNVHTIENYTESGSYKKGEQPKVHDIQNVLDNFKNPDTNSKSLIQKHSSCQYEDLNVDVAMSGIPNAHNKIIHDQRRRKQVKETGPRSANIKVGRRLNSVSSRTRGSSAEPYSNKDPNNNLHPKRSHSEVTERRQKIQSRDLRANPEIQSSQTRTYNKSIVSPLKAFSKSSIPILKSRLEAARRIEDETSPRNSMKDPVTVTMLWRGNSFIKSMNTSEKTKQAESAAEKRTRSIKEINSGLRKKNKGDKDSSTNVQLIAKTTFNPSCVINSQIQAIIYVNIFKQDNKNTAGIMNPSKFLEYINGRRISSYGTLAPSQPSTPRNRSKGDFSRISKVKECDIFKIIAAASSVKKELLNDTSEITNMPNLYFVTIEQKKQDSTKRTLEINFSVLNCHNISEISKNTLNNLTIYGASKELNKEEYMTLIEILHNTNNRLYLQELYSLCKKIIS